MKQIAILLSILLLVFIAVGCSSGDGNKPAQTQSSGENAKNEKLDGYSENTEDENLDAIAEKAAVEASNDPEAAAKAAAHPEVSDQTVATSSSGQGSGKYAVIETNKGKIVFKFYPDKAPGTVENFIKLANEGFYNGIKWHRVEPGFVVQGGDPLSKDNNPSNDGSGGPGYMIKAEFNDIKHVKGTVAMARSQDPNSAGSQFYICLNTASHLDGKYTVFGQVVEGMEAVEKIEVGDTMEKVYIEIR